MVNDVSTMKEFKERVQDKLKDDIGSLMPDSVLSELVQQVIQKEFLEPQQSLSGRDTKPSWFVQSVTDAIKKQLNDEVSNFVARNDKLIRDTVREVLNGQAVAVALAQYLGNNLDFRIQNEISNRLNNVQY